MIDEDKRGFMSPEQMQEAFARQEQVELMAATQMAAVQDEAETENADRDAVAASLAVMALENESVEPGLPLPVADIVEAPEGGFGPTLVLELRAAGVDIFPISYSSSRIVFSPHITKDQRAAVMAVIEAHDPTTSGMPQQRQMAFDTAMTYGNRITDQVERKWSNVERASFTAQEIEAKAILAGETMAPDAMLPTLAAHKGISAQEYAQQVLDNAATYRQLAIAAVILRRGADGLLSEDIDTPEKLSAAMHALREQAAEFVAQFGLKMED